MKDEWEIKWNQKTMRSQKFLCDRSFGFSSFLLTDANLSFFFFPLLTWDQIMLSRASHFLWTD